MSRPRAGSHDVRLQLRSSLGGRERWEGACLRRRPALCAGVEDELRDEPGVRTVRANPRTGRLLVEFDAARLRGGAGLIVRRALTRALRRPSPASAPVRPVHDNPVYRVLERVDARRSVTVAAPVLTVLASIASLVNSYVFARLFTLGDGTGRSRPSSGGLWLGGLAALLTYVIEGLLGHAQQRAWKDVALTATHRLRTETFTHVLTLDQAYFDARSSTTVLDVIQRDSATVGGFLEESPGTTLQLVATNVLVAVSIVVSAPLLLPVAFLPLAIVSFTAGYFHRNIVPLQERETALSRELTRTQTAVLEGIATVQSFGAAESEIRRAERRSQAAVDAADEASLAATLFDSRVRAASSLGILLVVALTGHLTLRGSVSVPSFVFIMSVVPKVMGSVGGLRRFFNAYSRAASASRRLLDVLDTRPRRADRPITLDPATVRGDLRLHRVSFGYSPLEPVLRELSLEAAAGQRVGIVGSSGAGKSTVIKLLLGLYDADDGEATLDDHPLGDIHRQDLRRAMGYVSQDVHLFAGTIQENIAYGRPGSSRASVVAAARRAAADDFIEALPAGYDTVLPAGGGTLSVGQRQRVAIARAIFREAPLLVLDEPTAAVDSETEAAVQRSLERVASGRGLVVVAHRLSTVRRSHRIYVMDRGRVVEQGTHDALVRRGGRYARLWRLQTGIRTSREDY